MGQECVMDLLVMEYRRDNNDCGGCLIGDLNNEKLQYIMEYDEMERGVYTESDIVELVGDVSGVVELRAVLQANKIKVIMEEYSSKVECTECDNDECTCNMMEESNETMSEYRLNILEEYLGATTVRNCQFNQYINDGALWGATLTFENGDTVDYLVFIFKKTKLIVAS